GDISDSVDRGVRTLRRLICREDFVDLSCADGPARMHGELETTCDGVSMQHCDNLGRHGSLRKIRSFRVEDAAEMRVDARHSPDYPRKGARCAGGNIWSPLPATVDFDGFGSSRVRAIPG